MKKTITLLLSLLMILCVSGCSSKTEEVVEEAPVEELDIETYEAQLKEQGLDGDQETFDIQSYVAHGIDCYKYDGIEYPAVFGEPKLSEKEMELLVKEEDFEIIAKYITNIPDCFRYMKDHGLKAGLNDDYIYAIKKCECSPKCLVNMALNLIGDNLEESGIIEIYCANNYYPYACFKVDGKYYTFNPFVLQNNKWYTYGEEEIPFVASSPDELIEGITSGIKNEQFLKTTYTPLFGSEVAK